MNRININIKFSGSYDYVAKGRSYINNIYVGGFDIVYGSSLYRACNHHDSVVFLSARAVSEKIKYNIF